MNQIKICVCDNHCCHVAAGGKKNKRTKIRTKNELGRSFVFIRHNCCERGQWLGDEILKAPVSA